jgi:2-alkenal reductase
METRRQGLLIGGGCLIVLLIGLAVSLFAFLGLVPVNFLSNQTGQVAVSSEETALPATSETSSQALPTLEPLGFNQAGANALVNTDLTQVYTRLNPGVVSIRVLIEQAGETGSGAGSGFVLDDQGHIVTNNHVVDLATWVSVVFFDGTEAQAEVLGTDPDSDLAVLKVDDIPDGVRPLPLGDSDQVIAGQWVIAIGNPFGLEGSMSLGIVSAVGRSIPSGATSFDIPQAIQTDAAINPGNSGGPLLDLQGEVIGVNAQIATGNSGAGSGVGFAIPSNVVRQVAPVIIEQGRYQWPWLGVRGTSVSLLLQEANNLDSQHGAYLTQVLEDGPAAQAGLIGASSTTTVDGIQVPTGGDIIIGYNDEPVQIFADLLYFVSSDQPGDMVTLTVLRDGVEQEIEVRLQERPE